VRVVHVSTHDIVGGAARAAMRIHRSLLGIGVDSAMRVAVRHGSDPGVEPVPIDRGLPARVRRWLLRRRMAADWRPYEGARPRGFDRFSDDRAELGLDLPRRLPTADVVHLHWVADFVDYGSFFPRLDPRTPLVWTLHDMAPLTGGCHYDAECGRFTHGCGACPQLGSTGADDLSRAIWGRKAGALERVETGRMHLVAGSRWLQERAAVSPLLGRFPSSVFPYGIDTDTFAPGDRHGARAGLGIEPGERVVLFVADSVENHRKGFGALLEAIRLIPAEREVRVVSIGGGDPPAVGARRHLHLGRIDDDRALAEVYNAADLFVIPSLQEAYGQTALEAISCGTPAVGFDNGGMRELIRPGETGALVPTGDAAALAASIDALLADEPRLAEMRRRCREVALRDHSLAGEARHYLRIYKGLLGGR
jgi:glycosyltransferase involved in cell wall biosynthesis